MPLLSQVEAMVIKGCDTILSRVGGGVHGFCTICRASGPVRYNPQTPGSAKPIRRENRVDVGPRVRPLQRSKRIPRADEEDWGSRKLQEQQSDLEGWDGARKISESDQTFANAELQRLKSEMRSKDSSPKSAGQPLHNSAPFLHHHDNFSPVADDEEPLSADVSSCTRELGKLDPPSPSAPARLWHDSEEQVPSTSEVGRTSPPPVSKNWNSGKGIIYGDGWSYVELDSRTLNRKIRTPMAGKRSQPQGSALFYGDGRKFEVLFSDANDSSEKCSTSLEGVSSETDDAEQDRKIVKERNSAKIYALRLLGIAPQTVHKLRQKLAGKGVSETVIESTITDLQNCGLQSDVEYAESFARSRWRSALWGPQRLKQELRQKGVCPDDIETALGKVFTNTSLSDLNENVDGKDGRWGMTMEASDHLLEKARRKWGQGGNTSAEARKRRMIGWLQRRGFKWSIISQILNLMESQDQ